MSGVATRTRVDPRYAGAPFASEDGRAFFQARLALFSKVTFLLTAVFYALVHLASRFLMPDYSWRMLFGPYSRAAIAIAGTAGLWWLLYRGWRLPPKALAGLDATGLLLLCTWISLPLLTPRSDVEAGQLLLVVTNTIIARAALVPTKAAWTLGVSAAATLPALVLTSRFYLSQGEHPGVGVIMLPIQCAVTAALAAVVSSVIYGLRRAVQEARRLGQYTLEEKLGEGGMGEVFRARHALLRRPTAVKILRPDRAGASALLRFEREVQLTSSLTHPNTVAVFDYGRTPEGTFYYAMEYLDGVNLEDLVREEGPQPPARIVHVLRQVCGSLAEAHGIGLVHRDIKPANIMLCERGGEPDVAKVLDFGLARELEARDDLSLTGDNAILGTPLFLPPEALTDPESVGPQSDLYALGVVAYYLLTGVHVFEGKTVFEICSQHLHATPVSPSERAGRAFPAGLESIVMDCLRKEPARRPQGAAELDRLLASSGAGPWTEGEAHEWWRRRRARGSSAAAPAAAEAPALRVKDPRGGR